MKTGGNMQREQAEIIAIQGLGWLVGQEALLEMFLASSGAGINDLKQSAKDPVFLGAVLDFILLDDSHVRGFCGAAGLNYDLPMQARQFLSGGEMVNWT